MKSTPSASAKKMCLATKEKISWLNWSALINYPWPDIFVKPLAIRTFENSNLRSVHATSGSGKRVASSSKSTHPVKL